MNAYGDYSLQGYGYHLLVGETGGGSIFKN